jgi:MFS family permease
VLTQLADWRAIFIVQAPIAGIAFVATFDRRVHELEREPASQIFRGTRAANVGLAFVFGALVGALFLSVLLVITVWELEPIVGALVVSALPAAAFAAGPLAARLERRRSIAGGAIVLAGGLLVLAFLPSVSNTLVAIALAFCGVGLGLAVPTLTYYAMHPELARLRAATVTIGARHLGLVAALALIAPVLTDQIDTAGTQATLAGTRVIMDGNIDLTKKVPISLDMRDAFEKGKRGEIPDLAKPFNDRGARSDSNLRELRDELIDTLRSVITRAFRSAFALSALFAFLTLIPASLIGRRVAR